MITQIKMLFMGPGWVAQFVEASSCYTKVAGSIHGQGTYMIQPMKS